MRTRANATNFSNRNLSYYFKRTRIELAMEGFAIRFKRTKASIDVFADGTELIPYNDNSLVFPIFKRNGYQRKIAKILDTEDNPSFIR
jgi:hypothetical protein